jgi:hypothetical protein
MEKESQKFIDLINEIAQDPTAKDIVEVAICKSKFHNGLKQVEGEERLTDRKILSMYKDDLMHRWNFLSDAEYEGKIILKKVDFWEIMDCFCNLG